MGCEQSVEARSVTPFQHYPYSEQDSLSNLSEKEAKQLVRSKLEKSFPNWKTEKNIFYESKVSKKQKTSGKQYYAQGPSKLTQQKSRDTQKSIKQDKFGQTSQLSKKIPSSQRKKYNVLNEFIAHTDRRQYKILVDFETVAKQFPDFSIKMDQLQNLTVEWIGGVFRMVASMCWNMLFNGFLTFDQTKILFTENIIYNYIEFMKELDVRGQEQHMQRLTILINKKSIEILSFLGKQYPQTKVDTPNIHLKEILPKIDNSARMKFDVIKIACQNNNFQLKFKDNGNYAPKIMQLINFMIDQVNQQYPDYEKQCQLIFEQIFKHPDKREEPQTIKIRPPKVKEVKKLKKDDNPSQQKKKDDNPSQQKKKEDNPSQQKKKDDNPSQQKKKEDNPSQQKKKFVENSQETHYRQKVQKYTKYLISRKISKDTPKFSKQEISNGVFYPKSPSILRIISKWVEQLTETIKKPDQYILSADKDLKDHKGNAVALFHGVRKAVCEKIKQNSKQLFEKIEKIKDECFKIESLLASPRYTYDSKQTHLSSDQISVGKFSVSLQNSISFYLFEQLNLLLHFLLEIPQKTDQKSLGIQNDEHRSQARKDLNRLNLVTMKIFDLLRCKCSSNEQEISWIIEYLKKSNTTPDGITTVRVKDRLSQGTRDILCNLQIDKRGFLSEMQLSVVSNHESKQEKLDQYNHFLYQQKRANFGPLSEIVSIWTVLEQRSLYFKNISRNPIPQKPSFHKCDNKNLIKFSLPICCESCINFYSYPETVYSNVKCQLCKKTCCGGCYSKVLSPQEKKAKIFQGMFKEITNHLKEHDDAQKPFPMQGVYLMRSKNYRRQINFFTVLIKNSQSKMQQIISLQDIKKKVKKNEIFKCEIIFTNNSVRKKKIIQKQNNIDITIKATLKNEKQLYIDKDDYKFFQKFLIYYFDECFIRSIQTIAQIETKLKKQQNQNHSLKIFNIMEKPVYIDQIRQMKKKSQKLKELERLKNYKEFEKDQKFLTFQLKNVIIVAKAYKDSKKLGQNIIYNSNVNKLKSYANVQKAIVSMQKHNIKDEFKKLKNQIDHKLAGNLFTSLRELYLNHNFLQKIQSLKECVNLEILYLKHNQLTTLEGIEQMKNLIVLRFDDNKIEDLTQLTGLIKLKKIMANKNQIKQLKPLQKLTQLTTLEFEQNKIEQLDPIKDLPKLQELNFKNNVHITRLPAFVSKCIKQVIIAGTLIKQLSSLSKYATISKLNLQNLQLKEIPNFICSLKLNQLWLGKNKITKITNLQEQSQLQILSLKDNKVTSLKGIEKLQKIRNLYMENNKIKSLQGLKQCLQNLKLLDLKNNPLDDIKLLEFADPTLTFECTKKDLQEESRAILYKHQTAGINSDSEN